MIIMLENAMHEHVRNILAKPNPKLFTKTHPKKKKSQKFPKSRSKCMKCKKDEKKKRLGSLTKGFELERGQILEGKKDLD